MEKRLYQLGIYEKAFPDKMPIYDMLKLVGEYNYDFFEISIDRTEDRISRLYIEEFSDECIRAMKANRIPIGSMCLSALGTYTMGHPDCSVTSRAMDILEHAVTFSSRLGIRIVQIPGCDVPKNESHTFDTKERYIENLFKAAEMASMYGVHLAIENMEDEFMDTVEKTMEYVNRINSPYLQIYPDSGNITSSSKKYDSDWKEDMWHGLGHYMGFHLKETRPNKYGGLFYGEGHVDFPSMVKKAWELGVRRFVMEYWYNENGLWREDLNKAYKMFERWVNHAVRVPPDLCRR